MDNEQRRYDHQPPFAGADGRRHFQDRRPFRFQAFVDNRIHAVTPGDTLMHLAGRYFAPLRRACGYWWVIADFQPQPVVDPIASLWRSYEYVIIPSTRALTDIILPALRSST